MLMLHADKILSFVDPLIPPVLAKMNPRHALPTLVELGSNPHYRGRRRPRATPSNQPIGRQWIFLPHFPKTNAQLNK